MKVEKKLPGRANQLVTLVRYEVAVNIYSKRSIFVFIGLALTSIFATMFLHQQFYSEQGIPGDFVNYLLIVTMIGMFILAATMVGVESLLSDFHERTGFFLFPNPVSRKTIWASNFLWCELIVLIAMGAHLPITLYGAMLLHQSIVLEQIVLFYLFSFLVGTMTMCLTLFYSSTLSSAVGASVASTLSIVFLPIADLYINASTQGLIPFFSPLVSIIVYEHIMPSSFVSQFLPLDTNFPDAISLLIIVGYSTVFGLMSMLRYAKREM